MAPPLGTTAEDGGKEWKSLAEPPDAARSAQAVAAAHVRCDRGSAARSRVVGGGLFDEILLPETDGGGCRW